MESARCLCPVAALALVSVSVRVRAQVLEPEQAPVSALARVSPWQVRAPGPVSRQAAGHCPGLARAQRYYSRRWTWLSGWLEEPELQRAAVSSLPELSDLGLTTRPLSSMAPPLAPSR